MFYKHDKKIINMLLNVHEHLKQEWDYLLVIVGDTGTGKSQFALQLLETWYQVILKREIKPKMSKQVASDYTVWLKNFQGLTEYDINIYDEGATTLESRQHMTALSKDLTKLFNVFRSKRFFTVIILPNFFYLNKYFRENRLRGLIWVNKRGQYKFYTKLGITYLNAYNESRRVKSMNVARPFHTNKFPDYKGILKASYLEEKNKLVDKVLKDVTNRATADSKNDTKVTKSNVFKREILKRLDEGMPHKQIREELHMGGETLDNAIRLLREEGLIPKYN